MREILFRAKTIYGDTIFGFPIIFQDNFYMVDIELFKQDRINAMDFVAIKEETLSQFTGLKDKNGNKVFENDIIKHLGDGGTDIVVFENGRFTSKNGSYSLSETAKYNFEVIGNRWEKE